MRNTKDTANDLNKQMKPPANKTRQSVIALHPNNIPHQWLKSPTDNSGTSLLHVVMGAEYNTRWLLRTLNDDIHSIYTAHRSRVHECLRKSYIGV